MKTVGNAAARKVSGISCLGRARNVAFALSFVRFGRGYSQDHLKSLRGLNWRCLGWAYYIFIGEILENHVAVVPKRWLFIYFCIYSVSDGVVTTKSRNPHWPLATCGEFLDPKVIPMECFGSPENRKRRPNRSLQIDRHRDPLKTASGNGFEKHENNESVMRKRKLLEGKNMPKVLALQWNLCFSKFLK